MNILQNIQHRFKQGTIVEKLIYVNILVFISTMLIGVFQGLFEIDSSNFIVQWFSLNSSYSEFLNKPWAIISYGFLHEKFIKILFNLIALYYLGNLFLEYFSQKKLFNFYLFGTFFGGILYLLSFNYFPLFKGSTRVLLGASAGVSAIFVGIATYLPKYQLKIRFIGFVKLWYLAAIWVGLDVLGMAGGNAGGHFSHLGGALFGYLYMQLFGNKKGSFFSSFSDVFKNEQQPLKTVYKSKKKVKNNEKKPNSNQKKIDEILDKIGKSGYDALNKEEKDFLFKQGKK